MLTIENTDVFGWEAAIRGARNPMNSWDKSDTVVCFGDCIDCQSEYAEYPGNCPCHCDNWLTHAIGSNDLKLMKNLANAGADHGKCIRFINVTMDITAPLYWWKEFKTYRKDRRFIDDGDEFIDPEEYEMFIETNSCSTMHKIHDKEFTLDDFSWDQLLNTGCDLFEVSSDDGLFHTIVQPLHLLNDYIIPSLNVCRDKYLETKNKDYWWQMIQLLPSSYNQKRSVQLNYQVLRRMYHARKHHKLNEWIEFCDWIKTLPYAKELIIGEE